MAPDLSLGLARRALDGRRGADAAGQLYSALESANPGAYQTAEALFWLGKIEYDKQITPKQLAQMTPGFTGAEIENLVNTAISEAVHKDKSQADLDDFEYSRDRIMMGIERKKLSMTEKDRLNTAIHESGHAVACYFTPGA